MILPGGPGFSKERERGSAPSLGPGTATQKAAADVHRIRCPPAHYTPKQTELRVRYWPAPILNR